MAKMNSIRSFNHQIYSIKLTKIGLSPYEDKQYISPKAAIPYPRTLQNQLVNIMYIILS